ncbi:branched-chain amino acid ABC transporter permease [Rhizobium leguminosarum]|uniref:branched-chain amino acid ABC transporter permease n=1 Tax=Rhizobium leguminosarum TaxID=384 RepID=UPI00041FC110|nr:branched-chain amino acid ABC transporter permease [Rhizobium leguminosarum]UIJ83203.1 branched-chain amino acid ABC transporter permease [Rhizobium leguminosarum]
MTYQITRSTPTSRIALVAALVLVAVLIAAPAWGSTATLRLLGEMLIYLALASLWNLLAGYTGLVSVGQQAYVGFGGYVLFSLAMHAGIHPLVAIPIVGLCAALISIPVAKLVFRLHGAYFAIGTWVVAEVFRLVFAQMSSLGGGSGTSLPVAIMRDLASSKAMRESMIYWTALTLGVGSAAFVYLLLRSRIGLALTAIRDSEIASSSLGIAIPRIKLAVYVCVSALTAMVGSLIFLQKLRIAPDAAFSVNDWTVLVIFMVVIGGIGTIEGPLVGVILFFLMRSFFADLGSIYLIILGVLAITIMIVSPRGIWGIFSDRLGISLLPVGYRVQANEDRDEALPLHAVADPRGLRSR